MYYKLSMNRFMNLSILLRGTLLIIVLAGTSCGLYAQPLKAIDIVRKADEKFRGEKSSYSVMTMTIIRPKWQRTIEFKSWSKGTTNSLTLITAPAREKGQSFLKRGNEMWSWNPAISQLIKLPPSMMSQGWMGSDYTNDDILKESSVVNDYTHSLLGEGIIGDRRCYKIRLNAREDADVLWGYQLWWVDKDDFIVLKAELYDEDGILVRTENGKEVKMMGGRLLPTILEIIPAEDPDQKTVVKINEMKFNIELSDSYFSQQSMKRVR